MNGKTGAGAPIEGDACSCFMLVDALEHADHPEAGPYKFVRNSLRGPASPTVRFNAQAQSSFTSPPIQNPIAYLRTIRKLIPTISYGILCRDRRPRRSAKRNRHSGIGFHMARKFLKEGAAAFPACNSWLQAYANMGLTVSKCVRNDGEWTCFAIFVYNR